MATTFNAIRRKRVIKTTTIDVTANKTLQKVRKVISILVCSGYQAHDARRLTAAGSQVFNELDHPLQIAAKIARMYG